MPPPSQSHGGVGNNPPSLPLPPTPLPPTTSSTHPPHPDPHPRLTARTSPIASEVGMQPRLSRPTMTPPSQLCAGTLTPAATHPSLTGSGSLSSRSDEAPTAPVALGSRYHRKDPTSISKLASKIAPETKPTLSDPDPSPHLKPSVSKPRPSKPKARPRASGSEPHPLGPPGQLSRRLDRLMRRWLGYDEVTITPVADPVPTLSSPAAVGVASTSSVTGATEDIGDPTPTPTHQCSDEATPPPPPVPPLAKSMPTTELLSFVRASRRVPGAPLTPPLSPHSNSGTHSIHDTYSTAPHQPISDATPLLYPPPLSIPFSALTPTEHTSAILSVVRAAHLGLLDPTLIRYPAAMRVYDVVRLLYTWMLDAYEIIAIATERVDVLEEQLKAMVFRPVPGTATLTSTSELDKHNGHDRDRDERRREETGKIGSVGKNDKLKSGPSPTATNRSKATEPTPTPTRDDLIQENGKLKDQLARVTEGFERMQRGAAITRKGVIGMSETIQKLERRVQELENRDTQSSASQSSPSQPTSTSVKKKPPPTPVPFTAATPPEPGETVFGPEPPPNFIRHNSPTGSSTSSLPPRTPPIFYDPYMFPDGFHRDNLTEDDDEDWDEEGEGEGEVEGVEEFKIPLGTLEFVTQTRGDTARKVTIDISDPAFMETLRETATALFGLKRGLGRGGTKQGIGSGAKVRGKGKGTGEEKGKGESTKAAVNTLMDLDLDDLD